MAPEYHIVTAGSLLGVAVNRDQYSFPVEKIDIQTPYPMNFEEFLLACGEYELIKAIHSCFFSDSSMYAASHEASLAYYSEYLVVGGMPDCVSKFVDTYDYILVRHTQDMILASYLNDMNKYNNANEIKNTLSLR